MLYIEVCEWDFIAEDFNFVENLQMKHSTLTKTITQETYDSYTLNGNAEFIYNQPTMTTQFIATPDEQYHPPNNKENNPTTSYIPNNMNLNIHHKNQSE